MAVALAQPTKNYVIFDQDARGPATTDQNSILLLLQSPNVNVLGITVVTGDQWRDEEVAHTLRLLELIGRTDVPVVPGCSFPMVRTKELTLLWEQRYGIPFPSGHRGGVDHPDGYLGAFNENHGPFVVPPLVEGNPTAKPSAENAANFLIQMAHKYPHQITLIAAGPLTDVAAAIILDSHFSSLIKELVLMGGSLNPQGKNPEFEDAPTREFNFWFDPEAASIVFHAPWQKIVDTPIDVSEQTGITKEMLAKLGKVHEPAAQYMARYAKPVSYMWDELSVAAWFDPSLITRWRHVYMDVDTDKGSAYGKTVVWSDRDKPKAVTLNEVDVQMDVDWPKFRDMFVHLMSQPTPGAANPQIWNQPAPEKK